MLNGVENERLEKALELVRNAGTKSYTGGVAYGRRTPGGGAP
jgi:hypothetical protein